MQRFPTYPLPLHLHSLSRYQYCHQSGAFVTVDELAAIQSYHPKSMVYIRVHSSCAFYGFGQMYKDMHLLLLGTIHSHFIPEESNLKRRHTVGK